MQIRKQSLTYTPSPPAPDTLHDIPEIKNLGQQDLRKYWDELAELYAPARAELEHLISKHPNNATPGMNILAPLAFCRLIRIAGEVTAVAYHERVGQQISDKTPFNDDSTP